MKRLTSAVSLALTKVELWKINAFAQFNFNLRCVKNKNEFIRYNGVDLKCDLILKNRCYCHIYVVFRLEILNALWFSNGAV